MGFFFRTSSYSLCKCHLPTQEQESLKFSCPTYIDITRIQVWSTDYSGLLKSIQEINGLFKYSVSKIIKKNIGFFLKPQYHNSSENSCKAHRDPSNISYFKSEVIAQLVLFLLQKYQQDFSCFKTQQSLKTEFVGEKKEDLKKPPSRNDEHIHGSHEK